jgi:hypothetical protein
VAEMSDRRKPGVDMLTADIRYLLYEEFNASRAVWLKHLLLKHLLRESQ